MLGQGVYRVADEQPGRAGDELGQEEVERRLADAQQRQQEVELAQEAELRAKAHRYMGMAAAILVITAVGVALAQMKRTFGVSPLEGLLEGLRVMPMLLAVLGVGLIVGLLPVLLARLGRKKDDQGAGK